MSSTHTALSLMVTIVVAINLILSVLLCYLARRIWQIRCKLARTADTLIAIERCTRTVLRDAPEIIYCGQDSIYRLRQSGEPLQIQLQQLRQLISLSVIGWQTWARVRNSEYPFGAASYKIRKS
ncbi:hypothetical protein [Scytonema millei]|nr:hypothetical protein [Scytonema millei]